LGSLRILLTNDDGYRSPGLVAVRQALVAAGHRVTVVAPLDNRSGSGASFSTSGKLEVKEQSADLYSVGGTPADAAMVGLGFVLAGETVDLVVSGANFGQNIGPSTLHSGTVGAAITAMQDGLPAIAISVGLNFAEARDGFPSTLAVFDDAADFVVSLIERLDRTRPADGSLMPRFTMINVNYPALEAADVAGARWATIGRDHGFRLRYERDSESSDHVTLEFEVGSGSGEKVAGTDTALFAEGFVTLSVLDGDLLARDGLALAGRASGLRCRLRDLVDKQ
jgi:5'-nucleotidase